MVVLDVVIEGYNVVKQASIPHPFWVPDRMSHKLFVMGPSALSTFRQHFVSFV